MVQSIDSVDTGADHIHVRLKEENGETGEIIYTRKVFPPGSDISEFPELNALASETWTPEVIAAYESKLEEI